MRRTLRPLFIVFGLVLYVVDRFASLKRSMADVGWRDALTMGLAQAIAFLASDAARAVHGVALPVSGLS